MYIYIYVCMYVYIYAYICVCVYTYIIHIYNALENSLENATGGVLEKIINKNPDPVKFEPYSLQLY